MIKIRRGNNVVKVSKKEYENKFKKYGYKIVNEGKEATKKQETERKQNENVVEVIDVDTIPIAEMTKEQLKEYAKKHNIDTTGAQNATQARKMIQKAVRERNA